MVTPFEEGFTPCRFDLEGNNCTIGRPNFALIEVDRQGRISRFRNFLHKIFGSLFVHHDYQEAVFLAIAKEYTRKAGRDHGPNTGLEQSPNGMFAAGAAAEVAPANDDAGTLVAGLVQREIVAQASIVIAPDIVKHALGQPLSIDPFEELLRHDDVSVDVRHCQRHGDAGMAVKLFQGLSPSSGSAHQ